MNSWMLVPLDCFFGVALLDRWWKKCLVYHSEEKKKSRESLILTPQGEYWYQKLILALHSTIQEGCSVHLTGLPLWNG